jgi:heterodisulfide reductase subunit B
VGRLYEHALETGAECLVVSCQMCQANLDMFQPKIAAQLGREIYLPVFYFTELIGLAFGAREVSTWLGRHLVNPIPFLKTKGLWD